MHRRHSLTDYNAVLQIPKWPLWGPKTANRVWKGVYPWVLGRSCTLSMNDFFYLSTPFIRKVDNRRKIQIDCNCGIGQSGISKSLAEYAQHCVLRQSTIVFA